MTILLFTGLFLVQPAGADSSDSINLAYCHQRIEEHYPTADKIELQEKITGLNKKIAQTGYYPDVTLSGMASYQSDVTEVTFTPPGAAAPTFSKDHYKLALDIFQPVYDGGLTKARQSLEETTGIRERNSVEVQLQQVKEQLNRVYFNILLLQQQILSTGILMDDLRQQLETVRSKVRNGVLLSSQASILEAELIKAEQDSIQVRANISGAFDVLEILIEEELDEQTVLEPPDSNGPFENQVQHGRPEYNVFSSSKKILETRMSLAGAKKAPKISAFATTAYGRPGLDAFDDDLQAYYVIGLRVHWNFRDAFNAGLEQQVLALQQHKIEADEQAFTKQLRSSLSGLREDMNALQQIIQKDEEIIRLSKQIVEESSSQLNQGIITATEYVTELHRLHQAQLSKGLHEIQLAQAKTDYQTKLGEPVK